MAPTCNLHTGGFLGPWAGFLIYRRQGRKNIKKIGKMLELEGRLEKRTRVGKDANSNRRRERSQGVTFGGRGLYMLSNFAGLKKKLIEKNKEVSKPGITVTHVLIPALRRWRQEDHLKYRAV